MYGVSRIHGVSKGAEVMEVEEVVVVVEMGEEVEDLISVIGYNILVTMIVAINLPLNQFSQCWNYMKQTFLNCDSWSSLIAAIISPTPRQLGLTNTR